MRGQRLSGPTAEIGIEPAATVPRQPVDSLRFFARSPIEPAQNPRSIRGLTLFHARRPPDRVFTGPRRRTASPRASIPARICRTTADGSGSGTDRDRPAATGTHSAAVSPFCRAPRDGLPPGPDRTSLPGYGQSTISGASLAARTTLGLLSDSVFRGRSITFLLRNHTTAHPRPRYRIKCWRQSRPRDRIKCRSLLGA